MQGYETIPLGIAYKRPTDVIGRFVCWWMGDDYSHTALIFRGKMYSVDMPHGLRVREIDLTEYPQVQHLEINPWDALTLEMWLREQIGKRYDWIALLGYLFGLEWLKLKSRLVCHRFCREALRRMSLVFRHKSCVTARALQREIESTGPYMFTRVSV